MNPPPPVPESLFLSSVLSSSSSSEDYEEDAVERPSPLEFPCKVRVQEERGARSGERERCRGRCEEWEARRRRSWFEAAEEREMDVDDIRTFTR